MRPPRLCARALPAAALLFACACAAAPQPPPPAPLRVETDHFAGTVLTGPTAEAGGVDEQAGALGVTWHVALLPRAPEGEPLPVRLVVVDGLPEPFRTRSELARGARHAHALQGEPALWVRRLDGALLPGTTAVLVLEPESALPDAPRPAWERLEVELSRRRNDPARLEVALDLSGLVTLRTEGDADAPDGPRRGPTQLVHAQERVVLEGAPRPGDPTWRLVFPAPTPTAPQAVVVVDIGTSSSVGAEVAERASERVTASRNAAAARATGLSGAEGFRIESTSALEALSRRELGRPALLYLASETGAGLVAELALVADVEALGDLLAAGRERLSALSGQPLEPQALGWLLESSAWLWLVGLAAEGDEGAALAPELEALLLRKAGEAGRWPDLLADAVAESEGVEALGERLVRENRIFLEDAVPAARVRAFDWLAARGLAPEGYDPLSPSEDRRAALVRLEEQALEAAESEEGGP